MNALRNILGSRTLNFFRQNGQNALINLTQPVDSAATGATVGDTNTDNNRQNRPEPLLIPKSILDATTFNGHKFASANRNTRPGSISPTTLNYIRRFEQKVELVYRCKLCKTRNRKLVSEAAYTSGVVILQCDGCNVNHLIIDHLGWFAAKNNRNGNNGNGMANANEENFETILAAAAAQDGGNSVRVIKLNQHGELI